MQDYHHAPYGFANTQHTMIRNNEGVVSCVFNWQAADTCDVAGWVCTERLQCLMGWETACIDEQRAGL